MNGLFGADPRWGKTLVGIFAEEPIVRNLKVLPKKPRSWDEIKEHGKDFPDAISIGIKTGTSTARATDNPYYKDKGGKA